MDRFLNKVIKKKKKNNPECLPETIFSFIALTINHLFTKFHYTYTKDVPLLTNS